MSAEDCMYRQQSCMRRSCAHFSAPVIFWRGFSCGGKFSRWSTVCRKTWVVQVPILLIHMVNGPAKARECSWHTECQHCIASCAAGAAAKHVLCVEAVLGVLVRESEQFPLLSTYLTKWVKDQQATLRKPTPLAPHTSADSAAITIDSAPVVLPLFLVQLGLSCIFFLICCLSPLPRPFLVLSTHL
jgi:hypothetical protein